MRILLSGATGLIGSEVWPRLAARGDEVTALSRSSQGGAIAWPENAGLDSAQLEGFDAVIHLAGESVGGRWDEAKKQRIYDSRVPRTRVLAEALATLKAPPQAFICASAIGIYGDRGGETLDENSAPGSGFLAKVCVDWEAACDPAREKMRVAHLRFGIVLSKDGGALKQMLLPFQLGVGGPLGDGSQFWSWITLDDTARAILHILDNQLEGAFNITAPHPVRNREFTQSLGKVLHRPSVIPTPAFALRLMMKDFADEGVLGSARVIPQRLLENGFTFEHPELAGALRAVLEN